MRTMRARSVAAWLLSKGIAIDSTTLLLVVFPIAVGVWHRLVLVLEARWPWLGVLLGVAKAPTYTPPASPN